MNSSKRIKIIKHGQGPTKTEVVTSNSGVRQTNRDIAGNVTEWIREFQENRQTQSGRSFASLFAEPLSPLERLS
jgi:hypothetical protein